MWFLIQVHDQHIGITYDVISHYFTFLSAILSFIPMEFQMTWVLLLSSYIFRKCIGLF